MRIVHGIFSNSTIRGMLKINDLTKNEKIIDVKDRMGITHTVICESGNVYRFFHFEGQNKGMRIHYAHIDRECYSSKHYDDIIGIIIKPSLFPLVFELHNEGDKIDVDSHIKYW